VDVGHDLVPEGEEGIAVGFFIFMDMDRGNFQGIVPPGGDLVMGDLFIMLPDVEHQQVEVQ
jgi:hypothetical protein